jgi:hypothetical protein
MAEWFKAAVLKTAKGASPSWVRIPLLPPIATEIVDSFVDFSCFPQRVPHPVTETAANSCERIGPHKGGTAPLDPWGKLLSALALLTAEHRQLNIALA